MQTLKGVQTMKKVTMTWGFVFLAMILCGPAQAAIEWDPALYDTKYMITSQGGTFVYVIPPFLAYDNTNNTINDNNNSTVFENFGTYPGSATLYAQSSGGTIPWGSQAQVYADLTYTDGVTANHFAADTYGMEVYQHVTASITRTFTTTGSTPMPVNLMAEFTGALNFDSFNYDYTTHTITNVDTYAYYLLSGEVTITEFRDGGGTTQGGCKVKLNNDIWSGSAEARILPASEDYYYHLSTSLNVDTFVKNKKTANDGFTTFPLDRNFFIGCDPENPFTLTATVPVPPSLFLLISGLGGLALARRRFSKGRQWQ